MKNGMSAGIRSTSSDILSIIVKRASLLMYPLLIKFLNRSRGYLSDISSLLGCCSKRGWEAYAMGLSLT